jgi:multicomponent Na+:H+ antiporter subunit D
VLLFASAGVFHHSGIKIPFFAFFAHDSGLRVKEAPWNMLLAMGATAALCVGLGVFPAPLYALLPYPVVFEPYTTTHVVTQLQLLLFSALAFAVLMRTGIYPPELPRTNLDTDWVYRRAAPVVVGLVARVVDAIRMGVAEISHDLVGGVLRGVRRYHTPGAVFGEPWPTGLTAMGAAIALGAYLLLYYL